MSDNQASVAENGYPYPATSAPHLVPPYSLLGGPENIKYLFDRMMMLDNQAALDNQSNARAYAALNLRRAENAATIDHLGSLNAVISAQTGDTSDQQTTDPIRTGIADTMAAASYTPNRAVDTASAGISAADLESVQTNVTAQVAEVVTQVATLSEMVQSMAGNVTTALQALADSNALIASALSALAPAAKTT
jgi:hypothetical protein